MGQIRLVFKSIVPCGQTLIRRGKCLHLLICTLICNGLSCSPLGRRDGRRMGRQTDRRTVGQSDGRTYKRRFIQCPTVTQSKNCHTERNSTQIWGSKTHQIWGSKTHQFWGLKVKNSQSWGTITVQLWVYLYCQESEESPLPKATREQQSWLLF